MLAVGLHSKRTIQMDACGLHITGIQSLNSIVEMIVRRVKVDALAICLTRTNLRIGTGFVGDMGRRTASRLVERRPSRTEFLLGKQLKLWLDPQQQCN